MDNKIDILINQNFTLNSHTLLYLNGKINLQKTEIFNLDPITKVEGNIYFIIDDINHIKIKTFIKNAPIIKNKIIIYDHFGNRLHILKKERYNNNLGNISIKTKSSPTLNNIVIPKHSDKDVVIVMSGSHFSKNIQNIMLRNHGMQKDLANLNCLESDKVIFYLSEKIIDNILMNTDILMKTNINSDLIQKYINNGQNIIEKYFGKSIKINENNIHSIINIPNVKILDIYSKIDSGAHIDFTIRSNGLELVSNNTSQFQLFLFLESDNNNKINISIDDKEYDSETLSLEIFPKLDFNYVLKLYNLFKLYNHNFFETRNLESLTHEEKLFIMNFLFSDINTPEVSDNKCTKFFNETFSIMSSKFKRKIKEKSIFNCTSLFNRNDRLTNSNFTNCQRQFSVPINNY
jgi:hypothetical protein